MSTVFYVYEHWRPDKHECFYVGKGHAGRAYSVRGRNQHHRAITNKLQRRGLAHSVVIRVFTHDEKTAFEIERLRVAFWRSEGHRLANKTDGGEGSKGHRHSRQWRMALSGIQKGRRHTAASRAKMSDSQRRRLAELGSHPLSGRKHTEEAVENMRAAAKVRGVAPATRIAQKAAVTGRKRLPFTDATREKMRSASRAREEDKRRRGYAPNGKRVVCVETGEMFASGSAAARHHGICASVVTQACLGRYGRKSAGGLHFKYADA